MNDALRLSEGIFLEDARELLPWYCITTTARMIMGVESYKTDKRTLVWEDRVILGGTLCALHGKFVRDEDNPAAEQRRLRYVQFFPNLKKLRLSANAAYNMIRLDLQSRLGAPTAFSSGIELYPFTQWENADILLILKISGHKPSETLAGEIWRKPIPKGLQEFTRME
jgi:hypothetical protein